MRTRQLDEAASCGASIAAPIRPSGAPPLLPLGAVKFGLAQLPVNVVMGAAKPKAKVCAASDGRRVAAEVSLEVVGADPAGVEAGEETDEAEQVRLLRRRGLLWVAGGDGVEEGPGAASKKLDVWGAVGARTGGSCLLLGLRCPGGERGAVAAAAAVISHEA